MTIEKRTREIMETFPSTRNSDTKLYVKYLNRFFWVGITDEQLEKMVLADKFTSIIRQRFEIQNWWELKADEEVERRRTMSKEEFRLKYCKYNKDLESNHNYK